MYRYKQIIDIVIMVNHLNAFNFKSIEDIVNSVGLSAKVWKIENNKQDIN